MVRLAAAAVLLSWASSVLCQDKNTKMVIGYFPNWLYSKYPVESIPFQKYTHINYAFAILNKDNHIPTFTDDWAVESGLPKLVTLAHAAKTKVLLSIGGWTGSIEFSPMVASSDSRKKFIDWNLKFIDKYNLDGVDLDWEYPGRQGAGCNAFNDVDTDNFLVLLKELRAALDQQFPTQHKEVSMAVHVDPWIKNGVPLADVRAFVPYFDHINIMTYDINGAWAPTTGPNAPFQTEPKQGASFSYVDSIRKWKAAGVPAEKITAGLAFYGRSMIAETDMSVLGTQYQASKVGAPKGDSDDGYWADPFCAADTAGLSGVWKWANIRSEGLLAADPFTAGPGWTRFWDNVTRTPWLFNPATRQYISYDDPLSLEIKVDHALCEGLAGVMVWDIHQDNNELLDTVNKIHQGMPATCPLGGASSPLPTGKSAIKPTTSVIASSPAKTSSSLKLPPIALRPESSSATQVVHSSAQNKPVSSSTVVPSDTSAKADNPCSEPGKVKCASSGKLGTWFTCDHNKWLSRDCGASLVCFDSYNSIYCGPRTEEMRADERNARIGAVSSGSIQQAESVSVAESSAGLAASVASAVSPASKILAASASSVSIHSASSLASKVSVASISSASVHGSEASASKALSASASVASASSVSVHGQSSAASVADVSGAKMASASIQGRSAMSAMAGRLASSPLAVSARWSASAHVQSGDLDGAYKLHPTLAVQNPFEAQPM